MIIAIIRQERDIFGKTNTPGYVGFNCQPPPKYLRFVYRWIWFELIILKLLKILNATLVVNSIGAIHLKAKFCKTFLLSTHKWLIWIQTANICWYLKLYSLPSNPYSFNWALIPLYENFTIIFDISFSVVVNQVAFCMSQTTMCALNFTRHRIHHAACQWTIKFLVDVYFGNKPFPRSSNFDEPEENTKELDSYIIHNYLVIHLALT